MSVRSASDIFEMSSSSIHILPLVGLSNPPSSEQEVLRLTLMAGLLAALRENSKHEDEGLWLFELGRRYLAGKRSRRSPAIGLK